MELLWWRTEPPQRETHTTGLETENSNFLVWFEVVELIESCEIKKTNNSNNKQSISKMTVKLIYSEVILSGCQSLYKANLRCVNYRFVLLNELRGCECFLSSTPCRCSSWMPARCVVAKMRCVKKPPNFLCCHNATVLKEILGRGIRDSNSSSI